MADSNNNEVLNADANIAEIEDQPTGASTIGDGIASKKRNIKHPVGIKPGKTYVCSRGVSSEKRGASKSPSKSGKNVESSKTNSDAKAGGTKGVNKFETNLVGRKANTSTDKQSVNSSAFKSSKNFASKRSDNVKEQGTSKGATKTAKKVETKKQNIPEEQSPTDSVTPAPIQNLANDEEQNAPEENGENLDSKRVNKTDEHGATKNAHAPRINFVKRNAVNIGGKGTKKGATKIDKTLMAESKGTTKIIDKSLEPKNENETKEHEQGATISPNEPSTSKDADNIAEQNVNKGPTKIAKNVVDKKPNNTARPGATKTKIVSRYREYFQDNKSEKKSNIEVESVTEGGTAEEGAGTSAAEEMVVSEERNTEEHAGMSGDGSAPKKRSNIKKPKNEIKGTNKISKNVGDKKASHSEERATKVEPKLAKISEEKKPNSNTEGKAGSKIASKFTSNSMDKKGMDSKGKAVTKGGINSGKNGPSTKSKNIDSTSGVNTTHEVIALEDPNNTEKDDAGASISEENVALKIPNNVENQGAGATNVGDGLTFKKPKNKQAVKGANKLAKNFVGKKAENAKKEATIKGAIKFGNIPSKKTNNIVQSTTEGTSKPDENLTFTKQLENLDETGMFASLSEELLAFHGSGLTRSEETFRFEEQFADTSRVGDDFACKTSDDSKTQDATKDSTKPISHLEGEKANHSKERGLTNRVTKTGRKKRGASTVGSKKSASEGTSDESLVFRKCIILVENDPRKTDQLRKPKTSIIDIDPFGESSSNDEQELNEAMAKKKYAFEEPSSIAKQSTGPSKTEKTYAFEGAVLDVFSEISEIEQPDNFDEHQDSIMSGDGYEFEDTNFPSSKASNLEEKAAKGASMSEENFAYKNPDHFEEQSASAIMSEESFAFNKSNSSKKQGVSKGGNKTGMSLSSKKSITIDVQGATEGLTRSDNSFTFKKLNDLEKESETESTIANVSGDTFGLAEPNRIEEDVIDGATMSDENFALLVSSVLEEHHTNDSTEQSTLEDCASSFSFSDKSSTIPAGTIIEAISDISSIISSIEIVRSTPSFINQYIRDSSSQSDENEFANENLFPEFGDDRSNAGSGNQQVRLYNGTNDVNRRSMAGYFRSFMETPVPHVEQIEDYEELPYLMGGFIERDPGSSIPQLRFSPAGTNCLTRWWWNMWGNSWEPRSLSAMSVRVWEMAVRLLEMAQRFCWEQHSDMCVSTLFVLLAVGGGLLIFSDQLYQLVY